MATAEETLLRSLLGVPTKGTIGDLRKAYYKNAATIIGGSGGGKVTKTSSYSLGGCAGANFNGYTAISYRSRQRLTKQATEMRVRIFNSKGVNDNSEGPLGLANITGVAFGLEGAQQWSADLANMLTLTRDTTVSTGGVNGTTPWASQWTTVPFNTKNRVTHVSYGMTFSSAVNDYISQGSDQRTRVMADSTSWNSATAFIGGSSFDYNYAGLEVIIDYRYSESQNDSKTVLFICHSVLAGYMGNDANSPGQMASGPQQWAMRTGNTAVVNGYTGSKATDWGTNSPKWNRFPNVAPDAIVLHLITNDIISGQVTDLATAQARYLALINTVKSKYPNVPIYVPLEQPYGATGATVNGAVITATMNTIRDGINAWLPTLDPAIIAGVFDFDSALRAPDVASSTTTTTTTGTGTPAAATYVSTTATAMARSRAVEPTLLAPDGQHPSPRGHDRVGDAITLT